MEVSKVTGYPQIIQSDIDLALKAMVNRDVLGILHDLPSSKLT
jgi:hypothetical protein